MHPRVQRLIQRAKLAQGWKEQTQFTSAFEAISAGRNDRKALDRAEQMEFMWEKACLGVAPLRGRSFTAEDDRPGAERTVMLGEGTCDEDADAVQLEVEVPVWLALSFWLRVELSLLL